MTGYHRNGWKFWVPTIFAGIGCLVGLSVLVCFVTAFNNVHVAVWGGVSGTLAGLTLGLHCFVRNDKGFNLKPDTFTTLMVIGALSLVSGLGGVIGYLIKGVMEKETGIQVEGSFIVVVWSFMTLKWGTFLYWYAKTYKRGVLMARPGLIGSLQI